MKTRLIEFLKKLVSWALIACLVNNPTYAVYMATTILFFKPIAAYADAFMDQAVNGQTLGDALLKDYVQPSVDAKTGTMTLNNGLAAGKTIQQNDLFQEIQPGSMDGIAASFGDSTAFGVEANKQLGPLATGTSSHALAYQTLLGAKTSMPDISHDPIWTVSDNTFTMTTPLISDLFKGCVKTTAFDETTCPVHVPDLKTCKKALGVEACTVTRNVSYAPVLSFGQGDGRIVNCGPGCSYLYIGTIGDNYWAAAGGGCQVFTWTASLTVNRPDAITKVLVDNVQYDDHTRLYLNDQLVYTGKTGWDGACELETNWNENPATDITAAFMAAAATGPVTIRQETKVGEFGEGFARLKVIGAIDITDQITDTPVGCRDRLIKLWPPTGTPPAAWVSSGSVNDQASTDWWQCTDADNARVVGGLTLTPDTYGHYLTPLYPGEPPSPPTPICFSAFIRMPGDVQLPCFIDLNGFEQCPTGPAPGTAHTSCDPIAKDPKCAWLGEKCAAGAINAVTGACDEFIETYDCGTTQAGLCDQNTTTNKTVCDSPIRCMGGECVDQPVENNKDFGKAVSALQLLNQVQQKNGCDPKAGTCELFGGEPLECQMADLSILGKVDCCNMPIDASWIQYMQLAVSTWELADASVELYAAQQFGVGATTAQGAWTLVTNDTVFNAPFDLAKHAWTAVTDTFTNMFDSVVSTFSADISSTISSTAISSTLEALQQTAIQEMSNFVIEHFGAQAGEALFSYTTAPATDAATGAVTNNGVATGMSQMLGSILNVIGIIYAIYQIAKMIVQLIFACTEDETKLNMLKDQRLCTNPGEIGTYCSASTIFGCIARKEAYCCFSSPFARIFQQQARPQLGMTFGDPKAPTCQGLTVNQIASLDFDKIDFSEWLNMMKGSGLLPLTGDQANTMYSQGEVTTSNLLVVPKESAQDRLDKQFKGSNIDDIRQYFLNNL